MGWGSAAAPTFQPAGRVEHAVLGEERHDRIQVVGVENVEHLPEHLDLQ